MYFVAPALFPVLMRRPWNNDVTGLLSVNNLEDFLQLIHQIKNSIAGITNELHTPAVIALVGPSGSGKTEWMSKILEHKNFAHPVTYTTHADNSISHKYISQNEFDQMNFIESTMYGGYGYGTKEAETITLVSAAEKVSKMEQFYTFIISSTVVKAERTVWIILQPYAISVMLDYANA